MCNGISDYMYIFLSIFSMEYTYSFIFISSLSLSLSHSSNQLILLFSLSNLYPSISPSTSFRPIHPIHPPYLSTSVMHSSTCENRDSFSLSVDASNPQILGPSPLKIPKNLLLHVQTQPTRCADNENYASEWTTIACLHSQLHLPTVVGRPRSVA